MGACILCGKSAGPFYSLHKDCYSKYDASNQTIADYLSKELGVTQSSVLANKIIQHIAECNFIAEAKQRTLNRALEFFASQYIDSTGLSSTKIQAWTEILDELSPDESLFVNPYFLSQQYNLPALCQLNKSCLPESNRHPANYSIQMRAQEVLWWCFDKSEIERDAPVVNKHQWSVMMQIINTTLPKKRKLSVEKKLLGDGKLLITNQRIFFESDDLTDELEYREIYSVTPVKHGVRLQSKLKSSIPQTYLCEDARLLFGFIKYAQNLHTKES